MNSAPHLESRPAGLAWAFGLAGLLALATASLQEPLERARLWQKAELHFHRQEYSQAVATYQEILARWPDNPAPQLRLGEIYLAQARWELAEEEFQGVLALNPGSGEALLGAGKAAMGRGKRETAINLWQSILAIDPQDGQAHYLLGIAYLGESDLVLARRELEAAVGLDLGNEQAHYYLGLILALEDRMAAIINLQFAAQGGDSDLHSRAGEMLLLLTDLAEEEDNALADARLGQGYLELDQPGLAAEALSRALALNPDLPLAQAYLGYVYFLLGDSEQALVTLLAAAEAHPQNPLAHFFLAKVYRGQDSSEKAQESLEQAIALDPKNAAFFAEQGALAWEKKDYVGGREAYLKATELAPQEVGFHLLRAEYHLSTLLWVADGLEAAQKAVALAPQNAAALEILGWAYALSGQPEEALGPLQESLRLAPGQASGYYRLGEVLAALGRVEEAHRAYQWAIDLATDEFWRERAAQALAELNRLPP